MRYGEAPLTGVHREVSVRAGDCRGHPGSHSETEPHGGVERRQWLQETSGADGAAPGLPQQREGCRDVASDWEESPPERPLCLGRSLRPRWPGSDTTGSSGGPACPSCCPTSGCPSAGPSSCRTECSRRTWCDAATSAGEQGGAARMLPRPLWVEVGGQAWKWECEPHGEDACWPSISHSFQGPGG